MFDERNIQAAISIYNQTTDCILWKDLDSNYRMMNNQYAQLVGLRSSRASFKQITDFDIPCKAADIADQFIEADRRVIQSGQTMTSIEYCCYTNGEWRIHYDRKSPLKDSEGRIIGISCYAIDVTECPIIRSALALLSIRNTNLNTKQLAQNSYRVQASYDELNLSTRQSEILFYMIRGKTAKEIARFLGIHYKTVEKHQEIIKFKMNCNTKSQLIEQAITQGVGLILPLSLFSHPRRT